MKANTDSHLTFSNPRELAWEKGMFGVGLHFSIKYLPAVRHIAVPGALIQVTVATAVGAGVALSWGWGPIAGFCSG